MLRIKKAELNALYACIARENTLYLPVKNAGKTNFAHYEQGVQVDIDTLKTVRSPKDTFFPQSENLYTCTHEDGKIQITPQSLQSESFVIFGIRACDVRGIAVLDKVFLSEPVDSFYAARRAHGIIVSLACHAPETSCFCNAFGIDCAQPEGDVTTWLAGEYLCWQSRTEKGEALTQQVRELFEQTDEAAVAHEQENIRANVKSFPTAAFAWRVGVQKTKRKNSILRFGKSCISPVLPVALAPLYVQPASATILKTTIQATAFRVTAAGTAVCILILP